MPLFLCRWPNGDCSFVAARNKTAAILALDEAGNAETAEVFAIRDFMLHLALRDDGILEFEGLGELARESFAKAYPFLTQALQQEKGPKTIRYAVKRERTRVVERHKDASSDMARQVQKQLGAPAALADALVEQIAKERLKDFKPRGKPH